MKKQNQKVLALFLAFVMLVSLVYVPGTSFTSFAEIVEQSSSADTTQPPTEGGEGTSTGDDDQSPAEDGEGTSTGDDDQSPAEDGEGTSAGDDQSLAEDGEEPPANDGSQPPEGSNPPAEEGEQSKIEDNLTDEERYHISLREQFKESEPQYPVKMSKFAMFSVAANDDDGVHLTPAGGKFFNGEKFNVQAVNHEKWVWFRSGYNWGLSMKSGEYIDVLRCDFVTDNRNHIYTVDRNIAIQAYGDDDISPFKNNDYDVQVYEFIDPPMIEGLELQSRTNESVTVVWDAPASQSPFQYTVWIPSTDSADEWEKIGTVSAESERNFTVDGLNAGQSIDVSVRAEYKGHINKAEEYFSDRIEKNFEVADFKVTTRILPKEAGSVTPQVSYYDQGEIMTAAVELTEGYEVKQWVVKELSENPVARALGFGDSKTIDTEGLTPEGEDEPAETDNHEFVVNSDLLITARAGLKVFTVEVVPSNVEAGSVSVEIESGKQLKKANRYQYGTVLNLSAAPEQGYMLEYWQEDQDHSLSAITTPYTVTENALITGIFTKEPVGLVDDQLTIQELNNGAPIVFSRPDMLPAAFATAGAPADAELLAEVEQDVPYGTTLKELMYHVNVKAHANNNVKIKDGARFVELSSLDLNQQGELYDSVDFEVYNTNVMMLLHGNSALKAPLSDGTQLRVKFKLHHDADSRFDSGTTALELNGSPYTNEVIVYTLNIKINVLDPLLKLNVQEGGKVLVEAVRRGEPTAADMEASGLFSKWVVGPEKLQRAFKPQRDVILTAESCEAADYEFDGWYTAGNKGTLISNEPITTISMNQNWNLVARFRQLDYTIKADPTMTQGKIQYRAMTNTGKKSTSGNWTDLPLTLHYGDEIELRVVPYTSWLFKNWLKPLHEKMDDASISYEKVFRDRSEVSFILDGDTLLQFPEREMLANAKFMSDYGFLSYHVSGIQNGSDLLADDKESDSAMGPVKKKGHVISFDYHVPYGTPFENAVSSAAFNVSYGLINESNIVKLYGQPQGMTERAVSESLYSEVVNSPHTVAVSQSLDPFEIVSENEFIYRYEVLQESEAARESLPAVMGREREERIFSKSYTVVVTVVWDEPRLTLEIPMGGTVQVIPGYTSAPETALVAVEEASVGTETLGSGIHNRNYAVETVVGLKPVAAEGYTYMGWSTAEGYTVPAGDVIVMDGNFKLQPKFVANQSDRRRRNTTTPQEEIAEILDETTPLGILYRQLFVGYPDGDLRMFDSITRGQLSLILQRAQQYDVSNPPSIPVTDAMAEWYRKEALTALGKGYLTLRSGNIFAGDDAVTGAELIAALNKAFGSNLTLEEAYRLANGVSSDQVAKILMINATDSQLASGGMVPLGVASFDADKPVSRETVARIIYAVLYPQAPVDPAAPVTPQ